LLKIFICFIQSFLFDLFVCLLVWNHSHSEFVTHCFCLFFSGVIYVGNVSTLQSLGKVLTINGALYQNGNVTVTIGMKYWWEISSITHFSHWISFNILLLLF
jgi:hypothetical protein